MNTPTVEHEALVDGSTTVSDEAANYLASLPAGSAENDHPEASSDVRVSAAFDLARELADAQEFNDRLAIYQGLAERFKSDARRILNIAAARWPELMPRLNGDFEWLTLLSADLS
ncbi:MAG: hypothetical protein AB7V58_05935 [Solirubrobacterales bacterium]